MICCIRPSGEDTTGTLGLGHFLHTFWRWIWRHFKYILDLGHSLDSFWKKVGDFLETFWFWRVFGDILVTFCRHFGIWMVFGDILESFWIHFGNLRYHNWTLVPKYQILMYLEKQGFLVLSVLKCQNCSISTTK